MNKVLITTVPFGQKDRAPLDLLESNGIAYTINPLNKKLTEDELLEMVSDVEVIIAGTEKITDKVMSKAKRLKMISRVGVGLDSVDLLSAQKRGIVVSYTPDAPAPAVAELTIGLMLALLRSIYVSNSEMHAGEWTRYYGRRLSEVTIGIIGCGRIGSRVMKHLNGFGNPKIMVNDIRVRFETDSTSNIEWAEKEEIYRYCDIVTIHLPLTVKTKNMIRKHHLLSMKSDAIIINSARGGIINESDLYQVLQSGHLGGAAIDVFDFEPYNGDLKKIDRCLLTAHMGSMSIDCRSKMEIQATEEAVRFLMGKPLEGLVPKEEYIDQRQGL
ncbi:MAG: lactate dehydrogenase [Euryarchaeota archaeon]|nr:lactate dehydrogenase [Euryarchaeota archaeon]